MIYFSSGDKGGVGKSLLANALINYSYIKNEKKVVIIDSDTRNSDVFRLHKDYFPDKKYIHRIDLSSKDGWLDLEDSIETIYLENPNIDIDFVISLPAGIGKTFISELEMFHKAIAKYNQKIVLFWSMDTGIDSINLLKITFLECHDFIDHIVIVKNLYYGENDNFYLWNDSNLRILLLGLGATEAVMPGLHVRLAPYYKTLIFDESYIKDLIAKNNIKYPRTTSTNNNYAGKPMPFFNIINDDIEIMTSIKNRLKSWLDEMSETFIIADKKASTGEFKERCKKVDFQSPN